MDPIESDDCDADGRVTWKSPENSMNPADRSPALSATVDWRTRFRQTRY